MTETVTNYSLHKLAWLVTTRRMTGIDHRYVHLLFASSVELHLFQFFINYS